MTAPVVIGNAILYLGDCLEILPTLSGIDAVVTDPPYSEKTHQGARGGEGKTQLITFPSITEQQFLSVVETIVNLAKRWVVLFCDWRHAAALENYELPLVRLGCWIKTNPMPQMSGDRPGTGWEAIAMLHRSGKKRWNGRGRPAVYQHGTSRCNYFGQSFHPTEKPIGLMNMLIRDFTDLNETILDPYMGSGSTGVACVTSGRKFIGIEIDPDYFAIACRRIEAAQRQERMNFEE